MTTEELIERYSPVGDLISVILAIGLLFLIAKVLYFVKDRKFIFLKRSLHFILMGAFFNLVFYYCILKWSSVRVALFVLRDLYHISFLCCLYCFMLYMKHMLDVQGKTAKIITLLSRVLFVVCVILELLSPLTGYGFHYENGEWQDTLISPYNFYYVYSLVILCAMLLIYSKRMIRSVRTCLLVSESVVAAIMVYQGFLNINTYSSFTYIVPVLVVLILIHSKPFDDRTGSLGSDSFENFVKQVYKKEIAVDYVVLKLYLRFVDRVPKELGKVLNSFWHGYLKDATLFALSSDLYVLAIPKDDKNGNTQDKMDELIDERFMGYYEQYQIPYKLIKLYNTDFLQSLDDLLGIIKYILQITEENSTFVVDEKVKEQLQKYKIIRDQLAGIEAANDLDDPRVLAYCQPIRNMKTGKFDTAEALMRLELPEIGLVMPGMFIELAEEYNHIHTLSRIILNKICKEIKKLENEGYAFERISINFAASEIKVDSFCDEILGIIKANGVKPSKIGIEMTETQTERDFQIVKRKIQMLRDAGMTLYLDDIGTGYSNLDRIVLYDVDVVKFDRFFLLEAEKSMKIVKMISHLAQAFSDLNYKLLFEGVETEAHEALCLNCGADYIQGFKYSKPIPVEEARNFFERVTEKTTEESAVVPETLLSKEIKAASALEMQEEYDILATMSKVFYSMHLIDLIKNTAKPYNPTEDIKVINVVNSSIGANEMMRQIMRMCTVEEHAESVLEFSDLTTIAERMKGKKSLQSEPYIGKSIGWYVAAFYTIETDSEGRPTKLVFTTRSIG